MHHSPFFREKVQSLHCLLNLLCLIDWKNSKLYKIYQFYFIHITLVREKSFTFVSIPSTLVNLPILKSTNVSITRKLIIFSQSQHSFHIKRCFSNTCGYLQFGKFGSCAIPSVNHRVQHALSVDFWFVHSMHHLQMFELQKATTFSNSIESIPIFQNWFVILTPFIMKLSFWNKT